MICVGVNHSVNRHQLMYKRKRHPRVEASQMPYSYQVAGTCGWTKWQSDQTI